jgi:hypothetical protein
MEGGHIMQGLVTTGYSEAPVWSALTPFGLKKVKEKAHRITRRCLAWQLPSYL